MTEQESFDAVCQRLMLATGAATESALAEALGFKPAAFSNRKKRAALPVEEIDELIRVRGLRAAWVYKGQLPMFEAGDKADQLEKEFREVVDQIRSSALHNDTVETLKPLIKGIVWRDQGVIEGWIATVGKLDQVERQIIAAYRTGGPEVQAAMVLIARSGTVPTKVTQTFHGKVGQVLEGSQTFHGDVTIGINSSRKK
jgi:hypothetical protein